MEYCNTYFLKKQVHADSLNYSGFSSGTDSSPGKINILAIGVGGAGGNVVRRMIDNGLDNVEYAVINTDQIALNSNPSPIKIPIGKNLTKGLGAGMKPDLAKAAAIEDIDDIRSCLENINMLFITAGMGGGTGTGASPVIAEIARELGILTIAVITTPFNFEGTKRMQLAENGIAELKKYIDTLVMVPNERLMEIAPNMSIKNAFSLADDVLRNAIFGISNLITGESEINLDFADINTVLREKGRAFIGIGTGKGESRGEKAAKQAMESPVLNNHIIYDSTGIIIHMEVDPDFTIVQVKQAAEYIRKEAKNDADIIWGFKINTQLQNEVRFTLIAAGFETLKEKEENFEIKQNQAKESETLDEDLIILEDEQVQDSPYIPNDFSSNQKNSDMETPTFIRNQKRNTNFEDEKKDF